MFFPSLHISNRSFLHYPSTTIFTHPNHVLCTSPVDFHIVSSVFWLYNYVRLDLQVFILSWFDLVFSIQDHIAAVRILLWANVGQNLLPCKAGRWRFFSLPLTLFVLSCLHLLCKWKRSKILCHIHKGFNQRVLMAWVTGKVKSRSLSLNFVNTVFV